MTNLNYQGGEFADRMIEMAESKNAPCVVGIDPSIARMPKAFLANYDVSDHSSASDLAKILRDYSRLIIDSVSDIVPVVKPQSAYFERYGAAGIAALEDVVTYSESKGLIVILDAKRGDIGETSEAYAQAYLSGDSNMPLSVDGLTLQPYLGTDSLEPFVSNANKFGKGLFICVRTSNPGAAILQDALVDGKPVYQYVADIVRNWTETNIGSRGYSSIGAVVGCTNPTQAEEVRKALPRSLFLVPGFGAQGGDVQGFKMCLDKSGLGAFASASRSVIYPHLYGNSQKRISDAIKDAASEFVNSISKV